MDFTDSVCFLKDVYVLIKSVYMTRGIRFFSVCVFFLGVGNVLFLCFIAVLCGIINISIGG